jgi:carbonic anhydrase
MSESAWEDLVQAHNASPHTCNGVVPEHRPSAATLACSDARVPPSVIFDQSAGSLFDVRFAGNTAGPAAVASLHYAVGNLEVDLIVVLGHSNCGAVHAAAVGTADEDLTPILAPIRELAINAPELDVDDLIHLDVNNTIHALKTHNGVTGEASRAGRLDIRGAVHDLQSSRLVPIHLQHPSQSRTHVETRRQ